MPWEIMEYRESLIEELIAVFNRETENDEFVVSLTPRIFTDQIASKPFFSPEGCFLAIENGKAVGFALTSPGIDNRKKIADPGIGVVDGLFFPKERLEVGDALLERCMDYFQQKGRVRKVYGFASFGGYPYWRGLYCGAEPVCLTHYTHAWSAFLAKGFTHHQQSINYLGTTSLRKYRYDLSYEESELDVSSQWARQSWKGHHPMVITAKSNGTPVGQIGYVELPYLSEYRQKRIAGIHCMIVYEEFRRQGVGTSLVNYLFDRAYDLEIREIIVGTRVENTPARRTYEKGEMRPIAFRTGTMKDMSDGKRGKV